MLPESKRNEAVAGVHESSSSVTGGGSNGFANELFSSLICVPCKYARYLIRDVLREIEEVDHKVEPLNVSVNSLITSHLEREKHFPYSNRTELQTLLKGLL